MTPVVPPPVKGLVNGRGAVNGTGMINGRGAINGTGVVNGTGITNGTGLPRVRGSVTERRSSLVTRWQFLAILVAVAIVIPIFVFVAYSRPTGLAIDGEFGDWSDAEKFGMQVSSTVSGIAVQEWSVQNDGTSLYMYVGVEGAVMGSSSVDSFYLFVDSDDSSNTGYIVSGMGADYMLELDGWDGAVRSTSVMEYTSTGDQYDWNSWVNDGSMTVSIVSSKLEAMGDLPEILDDNARYLLLSQTNTPDQAYSVSYPVPADGGLLIVRLEPGLAVSPSLGTVPAETSISLSRLVLTCDGAWGVISRIAPTVVNASLVSTFGSVSISLGEEEILDVLVDTSSTPTSKLVSVALDESGLSATFSDVVILGDSVSAYVVSAPASIEIDGAFGDWLGRLTSDNDSSLVSNPNINMTSTGFANSASYSAFYVSVEGEMFQGVYAPSAKSKPSGGGGGGGGIISNRKSGEDVLRIFIDSDVSSATGLAMTRSTKTIGAEYLIDVRGVNGKIVSQSIEMYDGSDWIMTDETVYAAKDQQRLELSVLGSSIGGNTSIASIIETTDWRDRTDWAWAASVPDPWVVTGLGVTYQSDTGALWNYIGMPSLAPGDQVVDIAMTTDDKIVLIVTNTGRTYYWDLGSSSTNWTAGMSNPIDVANYSEAVSMAFFSKTGAWLLTKNGSYFYLMDAISPPPNKEWTYQDVAASGVTDFTDINYEGGTMYALRSGPNTSLSFSLNGNFFTSLTNPTGSVSNQTEFTYIPGGAGSSDDRIFVLCENGNIRYSADGGQIWSAWGNLPTPTGGNTSKYVGLGIDSTGYMWVVTDTGYCYRSADSTTFTTFNYTGQAPTSGIVAIVPLPTVPPGIPEFQYLLAPVIGSMVIVLSWRRRTRGKDAR